MAAGAAAGHDDMDVVGSLATVYPLGLVARRDGTGQLAPPLEIGPRASGPCVEFLLDARLRPAVSREDLDVFRSQDDERLSRTEAAEARHGVAKRTQRQQYNHGGID